jgi:Zn2+/Cd2+-exporting ATPase
MERRFLPYTISLISITVTLLIESVRPVSPVIFVLSAAIGLIPSFLAMKNSLNRRRFPLELPSILTVLALLFLGQHTIGLCFVLLIVLGQLLKEYILWRVQKSIQSISKKLPHTAFIKDTDIKEIPITAIKPGDSIVLKEGSRAPVDGILLDKEGLFDQSVATGESKPVKKKAGDQILAGSISLNGYNEIKALNSSTHSTLAQIQQMVAQAQKENSPLSHFTQKYAQYTVIFALIATIMLYFFEHDSIQALSLWVALVPIIFALIIPVATTMGIAIFAQRGILVKGAEVLELLTYITTIAFDKTGTLTEGTPEIVHIRPLRNFTQSDVLQLAASVDRYSEHLFARPILKEAQKNSLPLLPVKDIHIYKGRGTTAESNRGTLVVGNLKLLNQAGIDLSAQLLTEIEREESLGNSLSFVALNKTLVGIIFLTDQPRAHARSTVNWLKQHQINVIMLTGDTSKVGEKVGQELGITNIHADILPQEKIAWIEKFKKRGEEVMMVGDGINDAPSLAAADVGVAMGLKGIDITLQSAKVILVDDDLAKIPLLIKGSRYILTIIKENLILASSIHLGAAILVFLRKIGILETALLHQVSSVLVFANTLRIIVLKNFKV